MTYILPKATPMSDTSFALCGVCGDEHDCGLGYAPDGENKILWCCRECLDIAPHVYGVVPLKASLYGVLARDYAGVKAGSYLESLGKTDLAVLAPEEWGHFLDVIIKERSLEIRRLYAGHVPRMNEHGDTVIGSEPVNEAVP